MGFNGSLIKTRAKETGYTLIQLSEELGVSRQAVNEWISGVTPRGSHLMKLCAVLNLKPEKFFTEPVQSLISVPLHRTIGNKKVTNTMRDASLEMAKEYLNLFRQTPVADLVQVIRIENRSEENAKIIADKLRSLSKVADGKPTDYKNAFHLLSELGIYTIFREFPDNLIKNTYAFYSKIADHRVVFVNIDTSIIDLIFYLLHETVHAVRDEVPDQISLQDEENFCDMVTNHIQFPDKYVEDVSLMIKGLPVNFIVNKLKDICLMNHHSLYGIHKQLDERGLLPECAKKINFGADVNLRKQFPTLRKVLFGSGNVQDFLENMYALSPEFMKVIEKHIPDCSVRKLGEWLGLDTSMDAQAVMEEMLRRKAKR
ncbi:MAG: ImmA/IrrE family metallo-endopeptidase [Fibrobacter sp.]|nr:ImmA/IrrE family metallo-endopeptidase [Fibrobacter sp.]